MEANDMKAMREALSVFIHDFASFREDVAHGRLHMMQCMDFVSQYIPLMESALAAPARNCDMGTAEEQISRFNEFCDSEWQDSGSANCGNCPLWVSGRIGHDCQIRWEQMPYEAQGGGAHECDKAL